MQTKSLPVEFDPSLVEEAVLRAIEAAPHSDRQRFRSERDKTYGTSDPELREKRFRDLHGRWFRNLGLADPLVQVLGEKPCLSKFAHRCLVLFAPQQNKEGADLRENQDTKTLTVLLSIRPSMLISQALLPFLRHELHYVSDMLDPGFEYSPDLPPTSAAGSLSDTLVRKRYRSLWDITIDGRLAAAGHMPPKVETTRMREFLHSFPMLGTAAREVFAEFFHCANPNHHQLMKLALDPHTRTTEPDSTLGRSCPLCGFPSTLSTPDRIGLSAESLLHIQNDFPAWRPEDGLCPQCADLYTTRAGASRKVQHSSF